MGAKEEIEKDIKKVERLAEDMKINLARIKAQLEILKE